MTEKEYELTKYALNIQVRNSEGKPFTDENLIKRLGIKASIQIFNKSDAKITLKDIHTSLQTWMPENKIEVWASQYGAISETWTTYYSVNEDGSFIAHK